VGVNFWVLNVCFPTIVEYHLVCRSGEISNEYFGLTTRLGVCEVEVSARLSGKLATAGVVLLTVNVS